MNYICGFAVLVSCFLLVEGISTLGALIFDYLTDKKRLRKEKKRHDRQRDTGRA